jgi:sporulation protein YlmC with PRC-barrel domain
MLRSIKDLRGYAIHALDGMIGKVDDFYLDDENWNIRHLVVRTGNWLSGRRVLISPMSVGRAGWMTRQLPVALTRAQVECSPDVDTIRLPSGRREPREFGHYGNPQYWGGAGLWGMGAYPGGLTTAGRVEEQLKAHRADATSTPVHCHLRSGNAVIGLDIQATDGPVGHLEDLLVDNHTWEITHLIVATGNWWDGHRVVVVSPRRATAVSWSEARVSVDLTRQAIRDSPPYDPIAQPELQPEEGVPDSDGGFRQPTASPPP